jgi:tetratricopeptide (TPR) repeat protein
MVFKLKFFNVGQSFEKKGDYQRAIEFYMKVTNKTDNVKLRIGTCYQLMKEFKKAVKWYLKMAHTDRNYLYVVDAYWEAGEKKETTEWLFRILQGFNGSDAEERALVLMDKYDYPERMKDFPNYDGRMSRIYVRRALANFSGNYDMAVASYKKAVSLTAKDGDMIRASMRILTVYEEEKENAQRKLDDKREEANDHYQYKLRQAEDRLRRAEHAYDRAIHEAENDYRWAIQAARNEQNEARRNLERMRNNSAATDLDLQNAKDRVRRAEQKFAYLYHNKAEFIDNEVYYERNKVREARRDYDHIMNSRHQIIEEYIRPYKRELAATTERYKKIRNLHQNIR